MPNQLTLSDYLKNNETDNLIGKTFSHKYGKNPKDFWEYKIEEIYLIKEFSNQIKEYMLSVVFLDNDSRYEINSKHHKKDLEVISKAGNN